MKIGANSLSEAAGTLAALKKLPMEQKCRLLLARLAKIGQNDSALNKHNLMLVGDPYGLASGYPDVEKTAVREHLLGSPWTKLVNEGFLVDLSGQGFHKLSAEGKEYLEHDEMTMPTPTASTSTQVASSEVPRAFLSYSWEGPEHREWVRRFAERLQGESGVEIIFDHWHLAPGDDKLRFMEQGVAKSEFVIVVCTPTYAERANERQGGVGYESMVITSELAEHMGTNKFIPVLRKDAWTESLPIYLKSRMGVNLSAEPYSEDEYLKLLRVLHRKPIQPPPIGGKPDFSKGPEVQPGAAGGQTPREAMKTTGAEGQASFRTDQFLADVISELEDNLDRARRPRTDDAYRQPSDITWLENRNKVDLPAGLRSQVMSAYHDISAWADIVRSGLHPNIGSMPLNLLASGLVMSLPPLIDQLRKAESRGDQSEQTVANARVDGQGARPSAETIAEMKKSGSIADAMYETAGPAAERVQMWVLHSPSLKELYMLENSLGEQHFGSREEIALKFVTANKLLEMRGFKRMNYGNRSSDRAFDL